jgi:large subunit ribosomal protein L32
MELPELTHCPQCGEAVLPYHVCPKCGTYRRAQVLDLKEKSKKEK